MKTSQLKEQDTEKEYLDLTTPEQKDWLYYNSDGKILIKFVNHKESRENYWNVKPTPKEGLIINPDVAVLKTKEDIINEIPFDWISKNENIYGKLCDLSLDDPVRNTHWDYLFFNDSSVFTPAANAFRKSKKAVKGTAVKPTYTHHLEGTKAYKDFWEEEFRRIKFGYEPVVDGKPCGVRISGEFYFYINYCPMKKIIEEEDGKSSPEEDFPDFLAMDYYWFKELEAREDPHYFGLDPSYKKSISCAKTRRSGFSYKCAAGSTRILAFENGARVIIASAPDSKKTDAALCAQKCLPILDHISNFTPFGVPDLGDPSDNDGWKNEVPNITNLFVYITLGYFNTRTKRKGGRQSSLITLSLSKDDAASGEGVRRMYIEEGGKVDNLDRVWPFTRESMKAGALFRGVCIIFGTGGSMVTASGKSGTSRPFCDLHYNAEAAELAAFDNIYEYKREPGGKKCGWFVSSLWCHFGARLYADSKVYNALDKNGNAFFWVADLLLNKERFDKQPPNSKLEEYNLYLTQKPKTASEAFLVTEGSIFQTADLINLQSTIRMNKGGFSALRTPGSLVFYGDQKVKFIPDLERVLQPITSTTSDSQNKKGCLLLYEAPKKIQGETPPDAYLITVDPIGLNTSSGKSLSSILVFKNPMYFDQFGPKTIVATYYGREDINPQKYVQELLHKLSVYYNAKITYENDRDGGVFDYFLKNNALDRLLNKPARTLAKLLPNSTTNLREFGHSMATTRHKQIAEGLAYEWLGSFIESKNLVDDDNNVVTTIKARNLDLLEDELLIEQLILYNRHGNFDAVMAFFGGILQLNELFSPELNSNEKNSIKEVSNQLYEWYLKKTDKKEELYSYKLSNMNKKQNA